MFGKSNRRQFLTGTAAAALSSCIPIARQLSAAPKDFPYVCIHEACRRPAFFMRAKPEPYSHLRSKDVLLLDGTPAQPATRVQCGSCGRDFQPLSSSVRRAA